MSVAWTRTVLISALGLSLGIPLGLGIYTFYYAKGASYFSADPRACVNCHVMEDQYRSWNRSSHARVATCVDCHLPHDFIQKYMTKAEHGFRHSWAFTTNKFDDPIRMRPSSQNIVEMNCRKCHETGFHSQTEGFSPDSCIRCHRSPGHAG